MSWLIAAKAAVDAVIPFVDLADGALQRRHEIKLVKHEARKAAAAQGLTERQRSFLDEITFVIFFYPWVALWVPYEPINIHAMAALDRIAGAPEILVWPMLLIVARIWGVAVNDIPARLWKR